jgi:hypothetical protein
MAELADRSASVARDHGYESRSERCQLDDRLVVTVGNRVAPAGGLPQRASRADPSAVRPFEIAL